MGNKKDTLFLMPGPLHLFWTSGVYFAWELSKSFNIVLIVDERYRDNKEFCSFIATETVLDVSYIPDNGMFAKHTFYARGLKRLVRRYRPAIVLHHDSVYVSMMYLHLWCSKYVPKCKRVCYTPGMHVPNWRKDHEAIRSFVLNGFMMKYRIPKSIARVMFEMGSWIRLIMEYYALPFVLSGTYFNPVLNIFSFRHIKRNWDSQYDYFLLHDDLGWRVMAEYCGSTRGFKVTKHPILSCGEELNRKLYNIYEEDIVLILPTYGYIHHYKTANKIGDEEIVREVAEKWIEIVRLIRSKYPEYRIKWKLHPILKNDTLWNTITERIRSAVDDIEVLRPEENAQKMILQSKVIVSEVSTVLWWASLYRTKTAISLNLFDPDQPVNENETGIRQFNNIDAFRSFDPTAIAMRETFKDENAGTVSEFLLRVKDDE